MGVACEWDMFSEIYQHWRAQGCSSRAAAAQANAQVDRVEQIGPLNKAFFGRLSNCAAGTAGKIGNMIGGWPEKPLTPREAIASVFAPGLSEADRLELAAAAVAT